MQNYFHDVISGPLFKQRILKARLKFEKGVVIHAIISANVQRSWNGLPLALSHDELIFLLEEAYRENGIDSILVRGFFDIEGRDILAATEAIIINGRASMPQPFRKINS